MRKLRSILVAVLGAAFLVGAPIALSGCMGTTRGQIRVVARTPPPPPRYVVVDTRPGHVWVRGHWVRYGSDWVWRDGYWTRERVGYDYVPGRWVQRQGQYYWVEPQWRKSTRVKRTQRAEQRRERPARDVEIRDRRDRKRYIERH